MKTSNWVKAALGLDADPMTFEPTPCDAIMVPPEAVAHYVYFVEYPNRDAALIIILNELKIDMPSKVDHPDRNNYHQDVISKTLKAIAQAEIGLVQSTLP